MPFVPALNHVKNCLFWDQIGTHGFKHGYLVKKSSYLYSITNFLPYPMWNIQLYFVDDLISGSNRNVENYLFIFDK